MLGRAVAHFEKLLLRNARAFLQGTGEQVGVGDGEAEVVFFLLMVLHRDQDDPLFALGGDGTRGER